MNRRNFLKISALACVAVVAAACTPTATPTTATAVPGATAAATAVPKATAAATAAPKVVVTVKSLNIAIQGWMVDTLYKPVVEAINKKLADDGTNIQWQPQVIGDWATYAQKAPLMFAAGEDFDWCFDAQWQHMMEYMSNNYLAPLEDLLAQYAPNVRKVVGDRIYQSNFMNGHLYGVPCGDGSTEVAGRGMLVREDLRLKYGIPEPTKYEDLEPFLAAIKQNEPDLVPLGGPGDYGLINTDYALENDTLYVGSNGDPGMIVNAFKGMDVSNQFDSDEYRWGCDLAFKWQQAGYLPKDRMPADYTMEANKIAAVVTNGPFTSCTQYTKALQQYVKDGMIRGFPAKPGFFAGKLKLSANFVVWNFQCFNKASKRLAEAATFFNWLYADPANSELLTKGIVGKHWIDTGPGFYDMPEGVDPTTNYSYPWYLAGTAVQLERDLVGTFEEDIKYRKFLTNPANYTPSPLIGFTFDPTSIKSTLAKETAVVQEYTFALANGNMDPKTAIPELAAKLKEAGLEQELTEKNKQVKAYVG